MTSKKWLTGQWPLAEAWTWVDGVHVTGPTLVILKDRRSESWRQHLTWSYTRLGCCTRLPAGKNRFPSATSAHLESSFKFRSLWAPIPFHISARKSSLIAKFTEGVNRSPFPMATPIPFKTPLSCPWDTSKPLILVASQLAKCCFCAEGWFLCGMSGGREMIVSGDAYTLIPSSDAV